MRTLVTLLITVITFTSVAVAQSKKDKIEIGVQCTSLTVFPPDVASDETKGGIGGRITYNFNQSIAAEAEINFFPQKQLILSSDGSSVQAQFRVKIGKRFEKLFGKARPGFVGFSQVLQNPFGTQNPPLSFVRRLYPSIDVGGVVEFSMSPRWMARFDVGDTIIRYGEIRFPGLAPSFTVPSVTRHNLQLSSGIGFCF